MAKRAAKIAASRKKGGRDVVVIINQCQFQPTRKIQDYAPMTLYPAFSMALTNFSSLTSFFNVTTTLLAL